MCAHLLPFRTGKSVHSGCAWSHSEPAVHVIIGFLPKVVSFGAIIYLLVPKIPDFRILLCKPTTHENLTIAGVISAPHLINIPSGAPRKHTAAPSWSAGQSKFYIFLHELEKLSQALSELIIPISWLNRSWLSLRWIFVESLKCSCTKNPSVLSRTLVSLVFQLLPYYPS